MLIDSHCHLHDREFFTTEQMEEMLRRANEADVKKIICIGTSHKDSLNAHDFATKHDNVYWTYGVHPESARAFDEFSLDKSLLRPSAKLVAIGEVGLDYHYENYDRKAKIRLFEQMLQLATDNNLPVSFHVREAFGDFFPLVANFPKVCGVVHSFTDNKKVLKRILNETDFYVGVNGLATYSTLHMPPIDRIILETDAPFLAPSPHRGTTNEPAYTLDIAKWLAIKLNIAFQEVAKTTSSNTRQLFKLKD